MTELWPWSPSAVAEWLPLGKAAGFFLATFVLEDAATIGAGLLLAAGEISWPAAFAACFLGIWFGDAGLYALARFGGRNWFERSALKKFSNNVSRSEQWFSERGTLILIFSRCVPGARLPTYLAAGFLRLPLPRFLFVTGAAAFGWTFLILWLAKTLGAPVVRWLATCQQGALVFTGTAVLLLFLLHALRRALAGVDLNNFLTGLEREIPRPVAADDFQSGNFFRRPRRRIQAGDSG
jgi:membrane protein DedA with SNARE-associated domain